MLERISSETLENAEGTMSVSLADIFAVAFVVNSDAALVFLRCINGQVERGRACY